MIAAVYDMSLNLQEEPLRSKASAELREASISSDSPVWHGMMSAMGLALQAEPTARGAQGAPAHLASSP